MRIRSNFPYLRLILGILVGVTDVAHHAQAAPICKEVLKSVSTTISQESIDRTIADIARFKMSMDLAKASGASTNSSAINAFQKNYKNKVAELITGLNGIKTAAEIKARISEKITELQSEKYEELAIRRSEEKLLFKDTYSKNFTHQERLVVPNGNKLLGDILEYVPSLDSLLFVTNDRLSGAYLLNLQTKESKLLFDKESKNLHVNMSVNRRFFSSFALTPRGENKIFMFDTITAQETQYTLAPSIQALKIDKSDRIFAQQLSPSGKSLLLALKKNTSASWDSEVYLIDLVNGKSQLLERNASSPSYLLLNDHEILYLNYETAYHEVVRYNFITGQKTTIYKAKSPNPVIAMTMDQEAENLIVYTPGVSRGVAIIYLNGAPLAPESISYQGTVAYNVSPLPNAGFLVEIDHRQSEFMTTTVSKAPVGGNIIHTPYGSSQTHTNAGASVDKKNEILYVGASPRPGYNMSVAYIDIWKAKK